MIDGYTINDSTVHLTIMIIALVIVSGFIIDFKNRWGIFRRRTDHCPTCGERCHICQSRDEIDEELEID